MTEHEIVSIPEIIETLKPILHTLLIGFLDKIKARDARIVALEAKIRIVREDTPLAIGDPCPPGD